jgi:SAM-dependent methyltransferase
MSAGPVHPLLVEETACQQGLGREMMTPMQFSSLIPALHPRLSRFIEQFHDWRLGIDTTEWHQQINPDRPEARGYGPTTYRDWRILRRHMIIDRTGCFIDYGAGLGRATILAARLPFKRVIGVEFDQALVERGNANIASIKSRLRAPCSIVHADARNFVIPPDASVLFFCNPFAGSILTGVLGEIRKAANRGIRPVQIICNLPTQSAFENEIITVPWLTLRHFVPLHDGRKGLIYTTTEPPGPS